jgi:hypothetical protein
MSEALPHRKGSLSRLRAIRFIKYEYLVIKGTLSSVLSDGCTNLMVVYFRDRSPNLHASQLRFIKYEYHCDSKFNAPLNAAHVEVGKVDVNHPNSDFLNAS